jgi:hypothetical protein
VTDQQVFKMCELVGSWLEEELAQKRRLLRRRG